MVETTSKAPATTATDAALATSSGTTQRIWTKWTGDFDGLVFRADSPEQQVVTFSIGEAGAVTVQAMTLSQNTMSTTDGQLTTSTDTRCPAQPCAKVQYTTGTTDGAQTLTAFVGLVHQDPGKGQQANIVVATYTQNGTLVGTASATASAATTATATAMGSPAPASTQMPRKCTQTCSKTNCYSCSGNYGGGCQTGACASCGFSAGTGCHGTNEWCEEAICRDNIACCSQAQMQSCAWRCTGPDEECSTHTYPDRCNRAATQGKQCTWHKAKRDGSTTGCRTAADELKDKQAFCCGENKNNYQSFLCASGSKATQTLWKECMADDAHTYTCTWIPDKFFKGDNYYARDCKKTPSNPPPTTSTGKPGRLRCTSVWKGNTDAWCDATCNHVSPVCPDTHCTCVPGGPTTTVVVPLVTTTTTDAPPAPPCQEGAQVFAHGNYVQQGSLGRSAYFKGTITSVNGEYMNVAYTVAGETRTLKNLPNFKVFDRPEVSTTMLPQEGDSVFANGRAPLPATLDCASSSDTCLAAQPDWSASETCDNSAEEYCADTKWGADIRRCCPSACAKVNVTLATAPCTVGLPAATASDDYHMATVDRLSDNGEISTIYWDDLRKVFPVTTRGRVAKMGRSCATTTTVSPACSAAGGMVFALFQAQPGYTEDDGERGFFGARYHAGKVVGEPRSDGFVQVAWSSNIGAHLVPNTQVFPWSHNRKQLDMSKWSVGDPVFAPMSGTRWYMGEIDTPAVKSNEDVGPTTVSVRWFEDADSDVYTQGVVYPGTDGATEDLFSRTVSCAAATVPATTAAPPATTVTATVAATTTTVAPTEAPTTAAATEAPTTGSTNKGGGTGSPMYTLF